MHRVRLRIKRPRWRWLMLTVVVLAVVGFGHVISAPSQGHEVTVDTKLSPTLSQPAAAPTPASNLSSTYFTLALPVGYKAQAPQTVAGLLYEQTVIKASSFGSIVISISIEAMPDGGLAGDTSYNSRVQQPDRYTLTTKNIAGDNVVIANDAQSAAVVAFWPHAGYLATIAASSGLDNPDSGNNADEVAALTTLLNAWQWQ